jgi:peptide/nickel transport system permease protein
MALQTPAFDKADSPPVASQATSPRALAGLFASPATAFGLVVLVVYFAAALASLLPIVPDPLHAAPSEQLTGPSAAHWMGTDQLGRDVLARVLAGARISLELIVPACVASMALGLLLGMVAGYFGGLLDTVIMRITDVFFAFPPVLLALAMVAALGAGIWQLMVAIAIVNTPPFIRIVRGSSLELRQREFVESAMVTGASSARILRRHVLPGVLGAAIVQATLTLSWSLITETALSFLGLGLQPPTPDLGTMLMEGSHYVVFDPWLGLFPGLTIMLGVLGFNLVGDALGDRVESSHRRAGHGTAL